MTTHAPASSSLVRKILDEEIRRHGHYESTEKSHWIATGRFVTDDGGEEERDEITPVLEIVSSRTGIPVEALRARYRGLSYHPLGRPAVVLWALRR